MGILNLKFKVGELKVEKKESSWSVSYPKVNKVQKTCAVCGKIVEPEKMYLMTTFTRRIDIGNKTQWDYKFVCGYNTNPCTIIMANNLKLKL